MARPAARCVGCEKKAAPGGKERQIERPERWGNRRRRSRRRGAATALEWRALRPGPRAVARSALPEASAVAPAAVRSPVTGEARTGEAGSAPTRAPARDADAERDAASAARSAGARTGRRMPGTVSGTSARPVSLEGKRSAQGAPATGGDRDCSGNRSEAEIGAESPARRDRPNPTHEHPQAYPCRAPAPAPTASASAPAAASSGPATAPASVRCGRAL